MNVEIDIDAGSMIVDGRTISLYSNEAVEIISRLWLKVGWDQKYSYGFSWLGRPVIQLPWDLIRVQEVIHRISPDVIVETGVAHGGSLIFYASLCKVIGHGRIVGIDVEIRPENRHAIEQHPLASLITLIEGDSADPEVVARVLNIVRPGEKVLVILDSDHSRAHVAGELEAYHRLVTPGSYIIATDGIMRDLSDTPHGVPGWQTDNPAVAAAEFAARHPEFVLEDVPSRFDQHATPSEVTYWPSGWLRRRDTALA